MARPTVAVFGLWHETNTFASQPTTLDQFRQFELAVGDEVAEWNAGVGSVIGGFMEHDELDLRMGLSAGAWPSGTIAGEASEYIFARSVEQLDRLGRVEGVLINLHGAMVAEDDDEPELRLVRAVREHFPGTPIGAVLDLHGNPSPGLIESCDIVLSYNTYPHVDMKERGGEVASLLGASLRSGARYSSSIAKLPLLATPLALSTDTEPMRGLMERAAKRGRAAGVARVSVVGGFAFGDVSRAGVSVIVVHETGARGAAAAATVLDETVKDIERVGGQFVLRRDSSRAAVSRAVAASRRPVVLADVADNVGGGSPGDGTALLSELVRQGCKSALVIIADAEVARACTALGPSGTYRGPLGGKTDDQHGSPVDVVASVVKTSDGRYRTQGSWMTGQEFEMGATVVLDVGGITIVVTERRVPPFHAEQVTSLGIDPSSFDIIVAKGAHAWKAAYGAVAAEVIEVDTPGICPIDPYTLPRKNEPVRAP